MKTVTHIVAADADEFLAVGEAANPLEQWSGFAAAGFDTVKIALLHCLLTGDTLQAALDRHQPLYLSSDEAIVVRLADETCEKLAAFDPQALSELARELAATADFEAERRPVDDVLALLSEVAELAQLAESQGQALFARIALLAD